MKVMNTSKNSSSKIKYKLQVTHVLDIGMAFLITSLSLLGIIPSIITKNYNTLGGWGTLILFSGLLLAGLLWSLNLCNQYIVVTQEKLIVSKGLIKKYSFKLSDVEKVSLFMRCSKLLFAVIVDGNANEFFYSATEGRLNGEKAVIKFKRCKKFADQVNAIIRERYPDNKPINYDEADEW